MPHLIITLVVLAVVMTAAERWGWWGSGLRRRIMTDEEVLRWYEVIKDEPEKIMQIMREHHMLKQGLCARTLVVPTGATNWVERSIHRATVLSKSEGVLRKLIADQTSMLEDAMRQSSYRECSNCMGTGKGTNAEDSCVCCRGTGIRRLSI